MKNVPSSQEPHFPLAVVGLSDSLLTSGHSTGCWVGADAIHAARLEAIHNAQYAIHCETYYMTPGRRANDFAAAIAERAQAGVKVQLIVDDHGVQSIPKKYWKRLRAARVEVRFFNEFNWGAPLNYLDRTHRKLLLIDGEVAFIGGAGFSDDWDGKKQIGDTAPWLDFEVCFEGLVVAVLEGIFMQQWTHAGGIADLSSKFFHMTLSGDSTILVTPGDDPSYGDASIGALFYMSILAARERVWVASPYFLPSSDLLDALRTAKKNGVDVRILTMGPHNDKNYVYYAARELYSKLLAAGIEIYEYQPSMMHAKVLLIDENWVSTGSANFDPRSFFHNDELHLSVSEPELAKKVEHFFMIAFENSHRVGRADWRTRPARNRILGRLVLSFRRQL
jgi:cardiolipin synthase